VPGQTVIIGQEKLPGMICISEQGGAEPWIGLGEACRLRPWMRGLMFGYVLDM